MNRIPLAAITVLAVTVMSLVSMLEQAGPLEAQSHTATRSFQDDWAAPGSELQVTVTASDYGDFGQVVEDLPDGFTFVGSSLDEAHIEVDGQTVRFNLLGETGFTYSVNVSTAEGQYTFTGVIKSVDREEQAMGGHASLRVGPAPTPTPTPTPVPTATPEPTATATLEPTGNSRTNGDTRTHAGADGYSRINCDTSTHAGADGRAYPNTAAHANNHAHPDAGY